MKLSAAGKRVPRLDGVEKVTGRTRYGADIELPGMTWGAVLRSPHPHARIRRLRTEAAERAPGVLAVITGRDISGPDASGVPIFAGDRVRYQGEAVAAVAAETREGAAAALRRIEIDYEPLPAVTHVCQAIAPDAIAVHEESEDPALPNIAGVAAAKRGDIEAGFAEADRVFEDTFETPWVHQGFLEPHVSLASFEPGTDKFTIWTSTQAQFNQRSELADLLGVPMSHVRVIGLPIGGAFGGKNALCVEPIAAELARRAGRPVKIVVTRRDDFFATRPCGAATMELKTGVSAKGRLIALEARLLFDTGAYPGAQHSTAVALAQGTYRVPNLAVRSYAVYTNKPPAGARRALTSPHVHFALESQLDIIAHALGIDPLELRLRNALRKGDPVLGEMEMPYDAVGKVIAAAAEKAGWPRRRSRRTGGAKARGTGLAAGHWSIYAGASSAWVQINEDGTISVVTGAVNLTGTNTSFAQIAAEEFGVPLARVTVHQGDTDTSPRNDGSWGSRVLFGVGEAVRRACDDAKRQMAEALADELRAPADRIRVGGGRVRVAGRKDRTIPFAEAAARATGYRGAITGVGALSDLPVAVAVAAQVAEVEVDRETGQVQVTRLVCAQDVGFAVNPMSVEGQIEGAASQGIGYALCEEYICDEDGRLLNPSFMDFRMPTSVDHPECSVQLVEPRRDAGPYGAKGVGEPPLVPTAAAVANAIFDAVGARVKRIPITPERLRREMGSGG
jgi:CO/xanthine dehydrogenase Mo-binding subunit